MTPLTQNIGDNKTFRIPLRWEGRSFTPGTEWNLIWTLFSDEDDPEGTIIRQKETDLGIVHSGDDALVSLVPQDTQGSEDPVIAAIEAGTYYWKILAVKIADGTRRHVADGTHVLKAGSTSLSTPSVTIYTTTPPSPNSVLGAITSATDADPLDGSEEFGVVRGGSLFSTTLTKIKTFVLNSLTIAWSSVTEKPSTFPPEGHSHNNADIDAPGQTPGTVMTPDGIFGVLWRNLTATEITGLGDSATLDVGTTAGTVAAGDHTHVSADIANMVESDPTGVSGADAITNIMSLTQAEYDAIGSPSATTLYVITD